MGAGFSGRTADSYASFRRDVPDPAVDALAAALGLGAEDAVLDLGAGTGQLAVPLARRVGRVVAVEPEPDMLRLLRSRVLDEDVGVTCVLGSSEELPGLLPGAAGSIAAVTVANALHWMDATRLFASAREVLRPGGGLAVVTHGVPLWLGDAAWAQALRGFLESWLGRPLTSTCGSDAASLQDRVTLLRASGLTGVEVLRQEHAETLTRPYIVGHIYSALTEAQVPVERRPEFELGLLAALAAGPDEELVEVVPVVTLLGRTASG